MTRGSGLGPGRFRYSIAGSDATLRQAVQAESARRLAPAIKPRYHVATEINHLTLPVDPQSGAGVVDDRSGPGCMERGRLNLEFRRGLSEVGVLSGVHKGVITRNRVLQRIRWHWIFLVLVHNIAREFCNRVRGEKVSLRAVDRGRRHLPALAFHCV